MTIERLPSGSYRVTKMVNGKRYRAVFAQKPTLMEAEDKIHTLIDNEALRSKESMREASINYIELKRNVLSVRTVREYTMYAKNRFPDWFMDKPLEEITEIDIQKLVNELSADKAPKTVYALVGFIRAILGTYRKDMDISPTMPQKVKKMPYIPTSSEVKQILDYTKEHAPHFYVPLALASYCGLRRSEILALEPTDLSNEMLTISKALVEDEEGNWVHKVTKTTESTRTVPCPSHIAKIIRSQGYVYKGGAQSIANYLLRVENELGISRFSLHKLRHFWASELLKTVPIKDVAELGGWSDFTTLQKIYAHSTVTRTDSAKREASKGLWDALF